MGSRKTFTDTEVSDILGRIERVAAHAGVDAVLTLPNTVRTLIPALAKAARSGAARGTLAALLMDCGFSRATAYRAVRLAFARAGFAEGEWAGDGKNATPAPAAPAARPVAAPPAVSVPRAAPSGRKPSRERYPANALPPHIPPGMTLLTAQDGGRVWIDCLPLDAHRDAPFGYDAQGQPWAPYGRDAQGRFRNYLGATLGVAGRTGRGHFVGEPDDP